MNSIKLVEAALESVPQLTLQAYLFFRLDGDPLFFSASASIGILSLLYALYVFLTTSQKIKDAMNALRTFFAPDSGATANPVAQPPLPLVPPLPSVGQRVQ